MNERSTRQLVLEVLVVIGLVGLQLYQSDADFKYAIDVGVGRIRHWLRRKRWEARWQRLPGWAQEAVEQIHGRQ